MFRDVTSVIQDADGLKLAIDEMIKRSDGLDFDVISDVDSLTGSAAFIVGSGAGGNEIQTGCDNEWTGG